MANSPEELAHNILMCTRGAGWATILFSLELALRHPEWARAMVKDVEIESDLRGGDPFREDREFLYATMDAIVRMHPVEAIQ